MTSGNPLGDIQITDPKAMRALAHPVRLAILEHLQRHGPATATRLAPVVGATPSVTSWHLRHLAGFGLVRDAESGQDRRERRWEAVARGFRFEAPEDGADEEGRSAARMLSREMFLRSADLPARWADAVEPALEPAWRRLSGLANTRVMLSPEEAAAVEKAIEQVLAPYVMRDADQRPADARGVRLLRYTLPEAGTGTGAGAGAHGEPEGDGEGSPGSPDPEVEGAAGPDGGAS